MILNQLNPWRVLPSPKLARLSLAGARALLEIRMTLFVADLDGGDAADCDGGMCDELEGSGSMRAVSHWKARSQRIRYMMIHPVMVATSMGSGGSYPCMTATHPRGTPSKPSVLYCPSVVAHPRQSAPGPRVAGMDSSVSPHELELDR